MELHSDAFEDGGTIPRRYSRDGENISPPLYWRGVPNGAREFAILMEDVTGREPFVHWLVYAIPANTRELPEGFKHKRDPKEPVDILQGTNSLGNVGYDGPLGTVGRRFRYLFQLFALDRELGLEPGADRDTFWRAAKKHVIATAELHATYVRGAEEAA